ncbi:hypothetical protein E4T56_gene18837, partial [Termitomyces sp. T112]
MSALPATMINTPLSLMMDTSPTTDTDTLVSTTMDVPPVSLPSTVEETLSHCPRFRILVVGNTGVGKSSLIASIFNVSQEDIDIADGHAGTANINREYTSDDNPRFALHDSKGFEPGSTDHWGIVQEFIRQRSKKGLSIEQRLHALWLCIETPRSGSRLMQTADEELFKFATDCKIPVIVVFTKFDLLCNEFYAKAARFQEEHADSSMVQDQVVNEAHSSLRASIEVFRHQVDLTKRKRILWSHSRQPLSCVGVSTNRHFPGFLHTLEELTDVTRKCLHTQETFVPWAVAQRIDSKQKVETSIEEGSKRYWKDMAKSTVFRDHILKDCLWRIHLDIIKVWNFRDPQGLLIGREFHVQMLKLIEEFVPQPQNRLSTMRHLPVVAALAAIFGPLFPPLAIALGAVGFTVVAIEFLYHKYREAPETALFLEAYIVDLTLFLHELFAIALQSGWQKPLDSKLVSVTFEHYKKTKSGQIHQLIRNNAPSAREAIFPTKTKRNIGDLIREQLTLCEKSNFGSLIGEIDTSSDNTHSNFEPLNSDFGSLIGEVDTSSDNTHSNLEPSNSDDTHFCEHLRAPLMS